MNSSRKLKPIKKLADNKEKVAAQNLGKSVEQRQLQKNRLEQLINYRSEYVDSMTLKTQQGVSGDKLHQYHQFLNKLDSAIDQQHVELEHSNVKLSQCQTKWQSDNSRASAIDKVMKNLSNKEKKASDKKETAQVDEMSTQAFLRRKIH